MIFKKKAVQISFALIVMINLCLTAVLCVTVFSRPAGDTAKYTMYIGLNDKDSYRQEIDDDEAREIVESVCTGYTDGFTLQNATGMWVDDSGEETHENTLVCCFYGADEETIRSIADELIVKLNQSSILIECDTVSTGYYQ